MKITNRRGNIYFFNLRKKSMFKKYLIPFETLTLGLRNKRNKTRNVSKCLKEVIKE